MYVYMIFLSVIYIPFFLHCFASYLWECWSFTQFRLYIIIVYSSFVDRKGGKPSTNVKWLIRVLHSFEVECQHFWINTKAKTLCTIGDCRFQWEILSVIYMVASKSSWNSLVYFTGVAAWGTLWINMYTLTPFVALGMQSEGNALKNVEPTHGFSFTTMLQHTSRFWWRIF
jgi:hypothetical protein